MFGKWSEISRLKQKCVEMEASILQIQTIMASLSSSLSNLRGIVNKKLYSGKMKEDAPAWLDSHLKLLGVNEENKNPDELGM